MTCGRVTVRDGFFVLLAALWFADENGVLPLVLLAAAVHEAGHLLALRLTRGRLHRLTLTACGAVIRCALPEGRCARAGVCLAGPAASFALAWVCMERGLFALAGASVLLGAFNLLPMPPLDGGMALEHLAGDSFALPRAVLAAACAAALLGAGVCLQRVGGGVWLLAIGALAVLRAAKELAKRVSGV